MLLELLVSCLAGSATGYVTNEYAINMLFKEYGIKNTGFKIGGVIKNTKDAFIDEISGLVEEDIISHKTLSARIDQPEFSEFIGSKIEKIDVSPIKDSVDQFIEVQVPIMIDAYFSKIFDSVYWLDLISDDFKPALLDYIEEKMPIIVDFLMNYIKENTEELESLINEAVQEIYQEAEGAELSMLSMVKDSLLDNLAQRYDLINKVLAYLEEKIDQNQLNDVFYSEVIHLLSRSKISTDLIKDLILVQLRKTTQMSFDTNNVSLITTKGIHFVNENLEAALKGNVKHISSTNLHRLSDDDLVDVVHEFMGKELKPISLFGGVLGGIAGLISGLLFDSSFTSINLNPLIYLIFGFVGYITNVIALRMLFKPYRTNKYLKNIPFLKQFSLGYIIQNRPKFAFHMGQFVKNELLQTNTLMELYKGHQHALFKKIESELSQVQGEWIPKILHQWTGKVRKSIEAANETEGVIGNLFDGKAEELILDHLPTAFEFGKNKLNKQLEMMKPAVVNEVSSTIQSQLGFLQRAGYMMMGGEVIVAKIIDRIIDQKVPAFLLKREYELISHGRYFVHKHILPIEIQKINLRLNHDVIDLNKIEEMIHTHISSEVVWRTNPIKEQILMTISKFMDENLVDVIQELNVSEITENEINAMSPEEIHQLFNRFAGHYFKRLERYGIMGAVSGIYPLIGPGIWAVNQINKKNN